MRTYKHTYKLLDIHLHNLFADTWTPPHILSSLRVSAAPDSIWIIQPITRLSSLSLVPDCDMVCSLKNASRYAWLTRVRIQVCRNICAKPSIKRVIYLIVISYNKALWLGRDYFWVLICDLMQLKGHGFGKSRFCDYLVFLVYFHFLSPAA